MNDKRKTLAIDCDEVLSDTLTSFIKFCNDTYSMDLKREIFKTYHYEKDMNLSVKEIYKLFADFYNSDSIALVPRISGAKEVLTTLSKNNDLVVVTARPDTVKPQTVDWLESNFPNLFKDVYFSKNDHAGFGGKSKAEICRDLSASMLIDDHVAYLEDCDPSMSLFLLSKAWNESTTLPRHIKRVYSWGEVLESLEKE